MPARLRTEFAVKVPHQAGQLSRIMEALSKGGVNVLGYCGWGHDAEANIQVVADNDEKARKALAGAGLTAIENPVVCVTTSSGKGAGAKLAAKLAKAGINVDYSYATTSGTGQGTAIFRVGDASAAFKALK